MKIAAFPKRKERQFVIILKGSSKNLMSFRCAVDLVGRLYKKSAGILTYFKDLLCKMTAEDTVQMSGKRFLEVPLNVIVIRYVVVSAYSRCIIRKFKIGKIVK